LKKIVEERKTIKQSRNNFVRLKYETVKNFEINNES
jgi:hypothetical protein